MEGKHRNRNGLAWWKKHYKWFCFLGIAVAFSLTVSYGVHLHQMQQQVAGKVIRFHVLANSDSKKDQALKLEVRDQVGTYIGQQLAGASSLEESREILAESLDEIETFATAQIQSQGYDYPVTASLERCYFPVKSYGKAVFPAGEYQALRLVIGEGEGKNWWCVLYPNLCFSGSLYQVDDNASAKELQQVLSPEEYKLIMENKDYQVGFRLAELVKGIFTNP